MILLHNVLFEQTKVWMITNILLCVFYAIAAMFLESRPDGRALSWICAAIAAGIAAYQARQLTEKGF